MPLSSEAFELFCDRSGAASGRYQSLAAISGPVSVLCRLRDELGAKSPSGREVKFSKLKGDAAMSAAAEGFIRAALCAASRGGVRIDVVTWDLHDERHTIAGRDDVANMGRMAFHLFTEVAKRHAHPRWRLFLDAGEEYDWSGLRPYLDMTSVRGPRRTTPDHPALIPFEDMRIEVVSVNEIDSASEVLIQLADLFAGFASFSHDEGEACLRWAEGQGCISTLPGLELACDDSPTLSRGKSCKYGLLIALYETCKSLRLGVGLKGRKHLVTRDPDRPVSFWPYDPQHPEDKAPTRNR